MTVKKLVLALVVIGLLVAGSYAVYRRSLPYYPYGWSHCCLKCLGLALYQYAENNGGHFPTGAGSPEASLSLLYRGHYGINEEILRGKTVPVEKVKGILERRGLLGPDSCGWHYVDGLTMSDDPGLALVWDKVGLGHNGEDLEGGHSVWFLHDMENVIPAAEWPQFLKHQEELMASRTEHAKKGLPKPPAPAR
jgi:hypothetical protein